MTKDELKDLIKGYFLECDTRKETYTIPGLAEAIGWSIEDVLQYPPNAEFSKMINYAKLKCENSLINKALAGRIDKNTAALLLKEHFGYKDKKEIDIKAKVNISSVLDEIESAK